VEHGHAQPPLSLDTYTYCNGHGSMAASGMRMHVRAPL